MSPEPLRDSHTRASHIPENADNKDLIIKIQVPWSNGRQIEGDHDMLVYTKKRDLVCKIRKSDNPAGYDKIREVVRQKGPMGAKAYFAAELKGPLELVVKIAQVLAEQPF